MLVSMEFSVLCLGLSTCNSNGTPWHFQLTLKVATWVNYSSSDERARAVVKQIEADGGEALAIRANVSRENEVEAMFAQIEADMANAKTAAEAEKAKLRGEGLAKGLEWLSGYLTPGKGQASSQSSKYPYGKGNAGADETVGTADDVADFQKLYADAYNGLLNYTGKSDALRILMRSPYSDWRKKAKAEYNKLKRRPGNNPSTGGNLTKYPQGTPQKGDPGYKKPKKKKKKHPLCLPLAGRISPCLSLRSA